MAVIKFSDIVSKRGVWMVYIMVTQITFRGRRGNKFHMIGRNSLDTPINTFASNKHSIYIMVSISVLTNYHYMLPHAIVKAETESRMVMLYS